MDKKTSSLQSSLLLLLTATIWGVAFVAQSVGMNYVGPFTFNAARFLIGALVLLPVILVMERKEKALSSPGKGPLLSGGLVCGIFLCIASNLQQFGIKYTTVGKAGFITACYIVLVPVLGLFLKKRCTPLIWGAVILALCGLYLLCITDGLSINPGDTLVMGCALFFSFQILAVDHYSPLVSGVRLSCIQFLVSAVLSLILALLLERPALHSLIGAWQPILYAGVFSCGVAYTLQIIGQKGLDPAIASLIMSLESCISAIAGWLLLGQRLSGREILGCVIMFAAIILAQLPFPDKKQKPLESL